jgi:predicted ATPase
MKAKKAKPGSRSCFRIVLTGGPGGGKTTAVDLFRREIGERVIIVPEAATILFQGGFPRSREPDASRFAQTTIFHVQRNLEDVQASLYPGRTLLCDRGTVDGAAYWPGTPREYFKAVGTTLEAELLRYDAVIFFETAAVGGASIEGGNPIRNESLEEAVELDVRLRELWSPHPRFILVPNNPSFFKKISFGLAVLESIVSQLTCPGETHSPGKKHERGKKQYP